jgi:hypothetical protein
MAEELKYDIAGGIGFSVAADIRITRVLLFKHLMFLDSVAEVLLRVY